MKKLNTVMRLNLKLSKVEEVDDEDWGTKEVESDY